MLDKKQIWVISYSSSKWVVKQQRQLATSATHLAQELLMNIQHSGGSRSFVKETRAFKMRSTMAGHQKLTATNWEDHQSWSLYNYVRSSTELSINQKSKNHCFEVSSSLIPCNKNEPFLAWILTCYKMWILYDNQQWPAQWLDQEKAPKHFPNPNLHQKQVIVTVGLIHYSFLNPNKAITSEMYAQEIEEMAWKLQSLQLVLANRKGPILLHDSAQPHVAQPYFNSWTNWAAKFCFIYRIHLTSCQRFTTSSSISATFCGENASTTKKRRKMLSKNSSNPEAWIFMLQE